MNLGEIIIKTLREYVTDRDIKEYTNRYLSNVRKKPIYIQNLLYRQFADSIIEMYRLNKLSKEQVDDISIRYIGNWDIRRSFENDIEDIDKHNKRIKNKRMWGKTSFVIFVPIILYLIVLLISLIATKEKIVLIGTIHFFVLTSNLSISTLMISESIKQKIYKFGFTKIFCLLYAGLIPMSILTNYYLKIVPIKSIFGHSYITNDIIILLSLSVSFIIAFLIILILAFINKSFYQTEISDKEDEL